MNKKTGVLLASFLGMIMQSASVLATGDLEVKLQSCAIIESATDRLDCYDKLTKTVVTKKVEVREIEVAKDVIPNTIPPDELGADRKGVGSNKNKEPESVLVRVVKCTKIAGKNKFRLHLEGGQIWNQLSDKRLNFKDCNFLAYINKDFFGYKMELKDTGKRFRVSRVK
ncbi:hypothetical protein [Glaciecola sp. KUL10]|uniref:hypothetical protein n=1 Tax=Glaciecola sp. (strain KUL10) TaxID=2161813 RepID=UPI000D78397E|nr:hypothetical protein [Glaciecola sp. KUL10]GBL03779.1 hypothetical protein KUL10_10790 [Glaciecola sp. KUL10]